MFTDERWAVSGRYRYLNIGSIFKGDREMETQIITRNVAEKFKKMTKVPFRELEVSDNLSFIFFQIGTEPYYLKVVG